MVGGGEELAGWRQRIGERESGGGRLLRGQLGLFRVTHKLICCYRSLPAVKVPKKSVSSVSSKNCVEIERPFHFSQKLKSIFQDTSVTITSTSILLVTVTVTE